MNQVPKQYIVRNEDGLFLKLAGPYKYQRWVHNLTDAERMSFGMAAQYAAAFGGTPAPADAGFHQVNWSAFG